MKDAHARETRQLFDLLDALPAEGSVVGQEEHAEGDVALGDQLGVLREAVKEERPGNIDLDASPVAGSAAMIESLTKLKTMLNDLTVGDAFAGNDETDAAGIRFENLT